MWQDLRYATRVLLKTPLVTAVAVLSLALGIGANTAVFSLINALLLRPLAVEKPMELVSLSLRSAEGSKSGPTLSLAMFEALSEELQSDPKVFSGMFAWLGGGVDNLEANGVSYVGSINNVSGGFFSTLGVHAMLGRLIGPQDVDLAHSRAAAVAVISNGCWRRRFSSDPNVVGKTMRVEKRLVTIVGVLPPGFESFYIDSATDVTVPIGYSGRLAALDHRAFGVDEVIGRLQTGVSIEQARAALETRFAPLLQATVPADLQGAQRIAFLTARPKLEIASQGQSWMRARERKPLAVLMGLVAALLLIACVNLANLMLARAAARRYEMSVRLALGSGRWRLTRQLLLESLMLSAAGAAIGVLIAMRASDLLAHMVWKGISPLALHTAPDWRVLLFTTGVSLLAAVLFGLSPLWELRAINPASALGQNARTVRGGAGRFGRMLVSSQLALSLVLVIGAALFTASIHALRTVDPGFDRHGVLTIQLFPKPGMPQEIPARSAYYRQMAEQLRRIPGVQNVSFSHMGPAARMPWTEPVTASTVTRESAVDVVGPGVFDVLGMHVLAGREFTWRDDETSRRVAIVSDSLARGLFGNGSAVGRHIKVGTLAERQDLEIVGVVNSASLWNLRSDKPAAVYMAFLQEPVFNESLVDLRVGRGMAGGGVGIGGGVRDVLERLGRQYPLLIRTVDEREEMPLLEDNLLALLSSFLGGLSLLLASVGLYGLMSYSITRRTGEIGIRMAIGADRASVVRLIMREVLVMAATGIVVGTGAAMIAARFIAGMLFGIGAADPRIIGIAAAVLIAVAAGAGYWPARRAASIEPMQALRSE